MGATEGLWGESMVYRGHSNISNPGKSAAGQIVQRIKEITEEFHIVSLSRQIAACEGFFVKNPLIDVAILGQFKAGKSSFINSLIGRPILPVGVIPVTTVITRLQCGDHERAMVTYFNGQQSEIALDEVEEYISETKNTANEKDVEVVDIEITSLAPYAGLRLVDTPGLGSVFRYNTEISEEWLPKVGAAMVAISSDRPLSENDLNLIRELMEFTPKVFLLLTKVDLLSEEQQKEVVKFFKDSLKREFNRDFQILPYSTLKKTDLYKRWLDQLLLNLSQNRDAEFRSILAHKIRSLIRHSLSYLEVALKSSTQADSNREILKKLIFDEKVNYDLIQSELFLIVRENMQRTRPLIADYLDGAQRKPLIQRLLAKLSEEMPRWKGNLWKLTRQYEEWLMENMVAEMDHISRADYKHFFGSLKKAHNSMSRSVELFRNLLERNIERVLGVKLGSMDWVIEVPEPTHPDVVFTKIFDFHLDILWFIFPMFIFRGIFEKHFLNQIARVVDIHLSRLAYQWEVRINKTIEAIKDQALKYVYDELSTIDALLSQTTGQSDKINMMIDELRKESEKLDI
jgi:GTP-binding protein EngB required for normal cell division